MRKLGKTIFLLWIIPVLLLTYSCRKSSEYVERTAADEELELKQTLVTLNEKYDVDTTSSGMYYIIHEPGDGPTPQAGDTCYLEYAIYFLNSVLLDASVHHTMDGIWEMYYLQDPAIDGFNEALAMMKKDMEADFLLPSNLAYGSTGAVGIAPYTPLLLSLKLHDLKPVNQE
ncbi:MAG: hypothetical protein CSA36_02065 [Draconibacterium sp.]|nr:MAG: hypothetical protein CSA36_02065 [Draconibacterium sp.]